MGKATIYHRFNSDDAVDLKIEEKNIIGQISILPNENGFLIRVWPPNGNYVDGGSNLTTFSCSIYFDENGNAILKGVHFDGQEV